MQAQEALSELEALAEADSEGTVALEAAVSAIAESGAPAAAPAPALSAETQRLLATDANRLDAELMEIFLIEATEVLDKVIENRAELERNLGDREALRSARRQFHTIKGSGRMVGLNELGELAYDVEKIHNRLLEEERDVTPAMLHLLDVAEANFRRWVGALQDKGDVYADPAELYAAIGRVEAEMPSEFESDARPSTAPAPVVAPAAEAKARGRYPGRSRHPPPRPLADRSRGACRRSRAGTGIDRGRSARRSRSRGSNRSTRMKTPTPRSSNSRLSARCPPASRRTTACPCHPTSSRSAKSRCRRISMRSSWTRREVISRRSSTRSRCCRSIRDACRPRKWSGRATRCAAFIAPAAFS